MLILKLSAKAIPPEKRAVEHGWLFVDLMFAGHRDVGRCLGRFVVDGKNSAEGDVGNILEVKLVVFSKNIIQSACLAMNRGGVPLLTRSERRRSSTLMECFVQLAPGFFQPSLFKGRAITSLPK